MRSKLFLLLSLLLTLPVSAEFLQGDALIARAKQLASELEPDAHSALTGLERTYKVEVKDNKVTVYGHKIWFYPTTASVQNNAYESIYFNQLNEQLTVLTAASISPAGKVNYVNESHQKVIAEDTYNTFTETEKMIVSFPAVEVGGITLIAYKIEETLTAERPFWSIRSYPQQTADMLNYSFEAQWDDSARLYFDNTSELVSCEQQPARVFCYAVNLVAAESDSVVNWGDQLGQITLSTEPDWQAVKAQVRPGFVNAIENNQGVQPLVDEFADSADGKQALIQRIFEFVARDIRYVSRSEAGYDIVPHNVDETIDNRFGDCKDKSALLIAMLRAINIDAEPVLVATKRERPGMAGAAAVGLFDHVVVCFSFAGQQYCLDPTDPYTQWQSTSDWIQGRVALNLSNDASLTTIPRPRYRWQLQAQSDITITPEGGQQELVTLTFLNEYASLMRQNMAGLSQPKRLEYMVDVYHEVANEDAEPVFEISGVDTMSSRLTTHSDTTYEPYFNPQQGISLAENDSWLRGELSSSWLNNEVYGQYYPGFLVESEYKIQVPHEWALNRFPPDLNLEHHFGKLTRSYRFEEGDELDTLYVSTTLSMPSRYLAVEEIKAFNDLLNVFYKQAPITFGHDS